MNPEHQHDHTYMEAAYQCPTSPWTEHFQSLSDQQTGNAASKSDDQRQSETFFATHDALSNIYNRVDQ